jgi:hypothetical protein
MAQGNRTYVKSIQNPHSDREVHMTNTMRRVSFANPRLIFFIKNHVAHLSTRPFTDEVQQGYYSIMKDIIDKYFEGINEVAKHNLSFLVEGLMRCGTASPWHAARSMSAVCVND